MNIIHEAKKYGRLVAGVLSDEAMIRYNRFPTISFEERKQMLEKISEVDEVVVQNEVMYGTILEQLKPDYVIHGDNWLNDPMEVIRDNVIENLNKWGGKLIEVPYTYNENVKNIEAIVRESSYARVSKKTFATIIEVMSDCRDFALKNKNPCSACEFQAKQGISIWGIKLLFFSV